MKLVVCERFLNVQTSKQCGKNWQLVRGPSWREPPPMVQSAQWLICHSLSQIVWVPLQTIWCTIVA